MPNLTEEQRLILKQHFAMFMGRLNAIARILHEEVNPAVEAMPKATLLDGTVHGIEVRALGWAYSLRRLDDIFDFQAHSAGCRSLIELVTDLVLLTRGSEPPEKLEAWEHLSRYRNAEKVVKSGKSMALGHAQLFVKSDAPKVAANRALFWKGRRWPPMRWTGNSLFDDAVAADGFVSLGLANVMGEHYDRLCWGTHGSGLTLVRHVSEDLIPGITILAAHESFNMLAHVIRLVLEHFKLFDQRWSQRIQYARDAGMLAGVRKHVEDIGRG